VGAARVKLVSHAFIICAELGGLAERAWQEPAAQKALDLLDGICNAVIAERPDGPAGGWARDHERMVVVKPEMVGMELGAPLAGQLERVAAAGRQPALVSIKAAPGMADDEYSGKLSRAVTLAFATPGARGVVLEGMADRLARDGAKSAAYIAMKRLIKETWGSEWSGRIDGGKLAFHGFYGTYAVEVDGYMGDKFTVGSREQRSAEVVLVKHNGQ
jgi:hypothetical protein